MLSGERRAGAKSTGDDVFGGTINVAGAFQMTATKVGQDTVLAQIVRMVAEAQGNKAPIQRLADRVSGMFVPVVPAVALATAIGWYFVTQDVSQRFLPAVCVPPLGDPLSLSPSMPTAVP